MLSALLGPFIPYIVGGVGLAALAAFIYVKSLISKKKQLEAALVLAQTANSRNVKAIEELVRQHAEYRSKMEELTKQDVKQAAAKDESIKEAEKLTGSDGDAITQEDLDKLAAAKKNRGK